MENNDSLKMAQRLKSRELESEIIAYWKESSSLFAKKGVVKVLFEAKQDTSVFTISSILSKPELASEPPVFFMLVKDIPVIFFTGLESELLFDSNFTRMIMEKTNPFLEDIPPTYNPVVWRITMHEGKVIDKKVLN